MAFSLLATCCPVSLSDETLPTDAVIPVQNAEAYIQKQSDGVLSLALMIENMNCVACLPDLEKMIKGLDGITYHSLNLSTRRLFVTWNAERMHVDELMCALAEKGYVAHPFDVALMNKTDNVGQELLKCIGIAGFASANIMLLSISIWAGLNEGMDLSTRTLFYWISALIAIPAVGWAGRPFFKSALVSLKAKRLGMDVPIALAVLLSLFVSVLATYTEQQHAYFDAGVSLLFFLLIGRYLDHRMRAKARMVAENLLLLQAKPAIKVSENGEMTFVKAYDLQPDDLILVKIGDRVMADGIVYEGQAYLDSSFLTGESQPVLVKQGDTVHAGTISTDAPLIIKVQKAGNKTLLSEIVRVMETAQQKRSSYVQLTDRVARWYAPVVHVVAGVSFLGWLYMGASVMDALMVATAVLIITCPCALALSVPVVQVVAVGKLLAEGIFVKSGDVLERLAVITDVYFDKTGTLTKGKLSLLNRSDVSTKALALAAALSKSSRHPIARCLVEQAITEGLILPEVTDLKESHGYGMQGWYQEKLVQLGNAKWLGMNNANEQLTSTWLRDDKEGVTCFKFSDTLRSDAHEVVRILKDKGFRLEILSGDHENIVEVTAKQLSVSTYYGALSPVQKAKFLQASREAGRFPLMVGDGLNDAPALLWSMASISHGQASDLAQNAADVIFIGEQLNPVIKILDVSRQAYWRMLQNISLSLIYNVIAVPLAIMGYVTPLWAAVAMSGSSLVVILNALRIKAGHPYRKPWKAPSFMVFWRKKEE